MALDPAARRDAGRFKWKRNLRIWDWLACPASGGQAAGAGNSAHCR